MTAQHRLGEGKEKCAGFSFNPTDEDIVNHFLKPAGMEMQLPSAAESVVRRVDMYGDRAPWEIFGEELAQGRRVFFAITRLVKRSQGRMSRVVGGATGGTWKGQSVKKRIKVGDVVAEKYTLSFMKESQEASEKAKKKMACSHWNMTEYRVLSYGGGEGDLDQNVVFCRLTYSGRQHQSSVAASVTSSSGRKRSRQEGDESINNAAKRGMVVTEEQQERVSALDHHAAEAGAGAENGDALASYLEPAAADENGSAGAGADDSDEYLDLIDFDVANDNYDDDGGPSDNTTEEICSSSSSASLQQQQQEEPNQQHCCLTTATSSSSQAAVAAAAAAQPAALMFPEEDADWAQIYMQSNGGIMGQEEPDDDEDFFSFAARYLQELQQEEQLGVPPA